MKKLYLIAGLVSLMLLIPLLVSDGDKWREVLAALGESGIVAIIIAAMIEVWQKREKWRKGEIYLGRLRREIASTLGRIAWFDARMSDMSFDWKKPVDEYWTKKFAIAASQKYSTSVLSADGAKAYFDAFKSKYGTQAVAALSTADQTKVVKMFRIVAAGSGMLLTYKNELVAHRLELATSDILSLEDNESVDVMVEMAMGVLQNATLENKNYGVVPELLLAAIGRIERQKGVREDIEVNLHCVLNRLQI